MRLDHIRLMGGVVLGAAVLVFVWGCGGKVRKKRGEWKLTTRTVQVNSYTEEGLLDKSFRTEYFDVGEKIDSVQSVVQRKYEGQALVEEKTFTIKEDGERFLSNEVIHKYDKDGNEIFESGKRKGASAVRFLYQYNDKRQVVQQLCVFTPEGFKEGIVDSVVSVFVYDAHGHIISEIKFDQMKEGKTVVMTVYKGGEKQSEYTIGPEGDTLEQYGFEREGELEKKISHLRTSIGDDTVWYRGEQIVQAIRHIDFTRKKIRMKDVYQYDEKGNETASFYYEAPW
jgi:hypothetical protein